MREPAVREELARARFDVRWLRPFCTSSALLRKSQRGVDGSCVRGNPTAYGGVDTTGGIALSAVVSPPGAA
eukprot:772150-Prymnesium_polylepis.1